jgi:hypothetical protein
MRTFKMVIKTILLLALVMEMAALSFACMTYPHDVAFIGGVILFAFAGYVGQAGGRIIFRQYTDSFKEKKQ